MSFRDDIFRITINNIKSPAFIIDQNGILISSNSSAEKYIPSVNFSGNFVELFGTETSKVFQQLFLDCLQFNKSVKKEFDVEFTNQSAPAKFEAVLTPALIEQNKCIIICSLNQVRDLSNNQGSVKLSVSNKEISEIINSEEILKIINEVKSLYPFTFLGKNKIQFEINRLSDAFWLKDKEGRYILVNQKFADVLGLKIQQIIGKSELEFVPNHLTEFFRSISKFIESTSNLVIREGLHFPQYAPFGNLQVLEFPLCDLDNKVIAFIGITQISSKINQDVSGSESLASAAIYNFKSPVLVINAEGIVKFKSERFSSVFGLEELEPGYEVPLYLPENISGQILNFISDTLAKEMTINPEIENERNDTFEICLRKIFNSSGQLEGCLILIQENFSANDRNNTIISREKMYEILLQTSPEPMFIYDLENLRFLEVNPAALEVYGYSKHEFLQMDLTDLYAPEDIQTLLDSNNSKNKEGVFTGPWRHKKRDGSSILVEISKTTFNYNDRKAHFNIVRDVTEKNEMLKELQLFKSVFENTRDMLFITDWDGFITQVNEAVVNFCGLSKDELLDRPFITLLSDESRAEVNNDVFHAKYSNSASLFISIKGKDGMINRAEMISTPVKDFNSNIVSFSIIVKPEIEKAVARPVTSATTVESVVQSKPSSGTLDPAFLSSMFHEILTPMNVILGFIQELTDSIESPTEEQQEAADIIDQNRKLLLQTMDSVLEYSHIEQNRVEIIPERVIFTEMLDVLQNNTKKLADSSKIDFNYGKISSSLSFEVDRHRFESLLTMFISIAMRITKEKKIFLSAYQYDDKSCIISIKDSRNSISEYLVKNLEELFTIKETDLKKDFGASKLTIRLARRLLGLLKGRYEIVKRGDQPVEFGFVFPIIFGQPEEPRAENAVLKQIIEQKEKETPVKREIINIVKKQEELLLDSDLDLESALKTDQPLKFFEERQPAVQDKTKVFQENKLPPKEPVIVPKPKIAPIKPISKVDMSRLKCLYVEDQVDSQILFKVQMKELQKIDFAVSFEAALPLLQQNKYDFIVMDINLQGEYNGLDALRIIRKLPAYDRTHVIAVTAYVLAGDKEKFIAAGFDGFISKPILREKLIEVLEKLMITE